MPSASFSSHLVFLSSCFHRAALEADLNVNSGLVVWFCPHFFSWWVKFMYQCCWSVFALPSKASQWASPSLKPSLTFLHSQHFQPFLPQQCHSCTVEVWDLMQWKHSLYHTQPHTLPLVFQGCALCLCVCWSEYLVPCRIRHESCREAQMMCVAVSREEHWTGESWPSFVMMQLLSLSLSWHSSVSVSVQPVLT